MAFKHLSYKLYRLVNKLFFILEIKEFINVDFIIVYQ